MLAAALGLVVLFFVINRVARRIPLRPLFVVTSAFLFFMAIKFIGEAIQEFQEQQIVPTSPAGGAGWLDESASTRPSRRSSAQLAVIVLAIVTLLFVEPAGPSGSTAPSNVAAPDHALKSKTAGLSPAVSNFADRRVVRPRR